MDLESLKWDEHNLDLYRIERRLEEYIGLRNEREIKIEEDYLRVCRNLKLVFFEDHSPLRGTGDWDFATTNWELNTTYYVSSPASIKMWDNHASCKKEGTLDIPEGRVVSYIRCQHEWGDQTYSQSIISFRNNDEAGKITVEKGAYTDHAYIVNGYNIVLDMYEIKMRLFESTTKIMEKDIISKPAHANVFNKYRFTFWVSDGVLIVRPEWYDESVEEWKKLSDDLTDTTPAFEELNNRIGIGSDLRWFYYDDIEIWKRI